MNGCSCLFFSKKVKKADLTGNLYTQGSSAQKDSSISDYRNYGELQFLDVTMLIMGR